ncbi:hypothetical protein BH721_03870 [Clostridium baratii]|uniref:hypothetical protein n=1 Tax=Clostridium baratii TaxID=1561 RepID=UPI0009A345FD|nr:hypothetical protein [Clostridium baratii]OPF52401.1 hypothetical protein A1M12_10075 [Clostridium baratii]OPF55851.1 hypothetical protein BH721_03870 [Clostridium baratii]OPF56768.1 hypothetical protein BH724_09555 [Clostridium baratii]OPF59767.1 hypothetical protein BH725_04055 [Clostridium baratii]
MKSNAIVSLAILKVNYDEKKDYLDTFLPIVAECIRIGEHDIIGISNIQQAVKKEFSLDIPQHAIKALLNKAYRAKYLRKENNMFYRNHDKLNELNFKDIKNDMLRKQKELIVDLIGYVKKNFGEEWSSEESEEYLLKFIESNQIMSFKNKIIVDEKTEKNVNINKEKLYIAKYIESLINTESYLFDYLEDIVKGVIISTVVFMNEPSEVNKNFKKMSVYLDTTFIIFALGYAGNEKKPQCDELLKLIYENNIKAKCFRHTVDEAIGILTACAYKIERKEIGQAHGSSMDYFIENGKSKSDIMLMINTIESDLNKLNIKIEDVPKYNNKCYIDEEGLKESLSKNIQYGNEEALNRDVKSISAITRLRGGRKTIKIEDSLAIFVTTNNKLIRTVNSYLNIDEELTGVMPIISDYALTNLLWLKKPLVAKELSRKRIIAECYAVSQPDEILWGKYIREVDKLKNQGNISEDESDYFKYAPVIKEICMDITHGESDVICEGTVLEIIQRARDIISKEATDKLSSDIEEAKRVNYENKKQILDKDREIKKKEESILVYAEKKAKNVENAIKYILFGVSGILIIFGQNAISKFVEVKFTIFSYWFDIVTFIVALVVWVFSIKGESIQSISRKIGEIRYNKIMSEINDANQELVVDSEKK